MATKTVSFNTQYCHLCDSHLEQAAKWLSCNGEVWGVGPTAVFASAAALFLYNELEATIFMVGDHLHVSLLEKTMVSTMVLGMLALMIHLWVCSMRFFQYYLDTLIKDSPNMLLEMTTAGLLGGQELAALGPLTRFLKTQQPQIHITICWFLSLCYADYVRKHYCQRFNMPYLEQWQAELQDRAARQARHAMARAHSFVGSVHQRLRGFAPPAPARRQSDQHTGSVSPKSSLEGGCGARAGGRGAGSDCAVRGGGSECTVRARPAFPDLPLRLLSQSSDTAVDALEKLRNYIQLVKWAKCGESYTSVTPTILWAVGTAALAQRLLSALFRRFIFRRVPLWELVLQNLLFIWMVIYSLHFWVMLVKLIKVFIEHCYDDASIPGFNSEKSLLTLEELSNRRVTQQWVIWLCGVVPLAVYVHTRPRPAPPPLMIWITTSPWLRREMGPYGYYLNRPLSTLTSNTMLSERQQALTLRKAFSDSRVLVKEPVKRKRHSKSV